MSFVGAVVAKDPKGKFEVDVDGLDPEESSSTRSSRHSGSSGFSKHFEGTDFSEFPTGNMEMFGLEYIKGFNAGGQN
jgi:hypothetical protein